MEIRTSTALRILPRYTGVTSLEEALEHPQACRLLWLDILLNDQLDLTAHQENDEIQKAFKKASSWFTTYRSLIHFVLNRNPLPHETYPIDMREYRTFAEALRFVWAPAPLTIDRLISLLQDFYQKKKISVELILIGGLALQAYGYAHRATQDVDGEIKGNFDAVMEFFQQNQIPADLGENISGWSVVAMPPGYRDRTTVFFEEEGIRILLLHPLDFIIAKLRRGTELDLDDSTYVAKQFGVSSHDIQLSAESALAISPKDTTLFIFRKTVELFCKTKISD